MYFFCFQVHGPIIGGRLVTRILRHFDHLLDTSVVKRAKTIPRTLTWDRNNRSLQRLCQQVRALYN